MVTVMELVEAADLTDASKPGVKAALGALGYEEHEEVGEAFLMLTETQLRSKGLTEREANAILVKITPRADTSIAEVSAKMDRIEKMLEASSEHTRQASSMSADDLDTIMQSLHCVIVAAEDDTKEDLEDETECKWQDNKYEPHLQEKYSKVLRDTVQLPSHARWVEKAKDNASVLKTSTTSGGAELPFPIECKTDELIVMGRSKVIIEGSVAASVEVKRKVAKQSLRETATQFICASLKSQLPIISTVTDMQHVGVAYYTTGQKTPEGRTIITQRVFTSPAAMMHFLGEAMRSIQPDALRLDDEGHFNLPEVLQKPKRMRLPVPQLSPTAVLQGLGLVQQLKEGTDVANLADVAHVDAQ